MPCHCPIVIPLEEVPINFSSACHYQGFLPVEDVIPFFALMEMLPFFEDIFIHLLSLQDLLVFLSCVEGSNKEGVW